MPFDHPYSPLALMGYKSGVNAGFKSDRQRVVRSTFRADLRKYLEEDKYSASGAAEWGPPLSETRFRAIFDCLASWGAEFRRKGFEDAARHRFEGLRYLVEELYDPEFQWDWKTGLERYEISW